MFGQEGGRLKGEDVHAFLQFRHAYEINDDSLLFIFNKYPPPFGPNEETETLTELLHLLHDDKGNSVCEKVPACFIKDLGYRLQLKTPDADEARTTLITHILTRTPNLHKKIHELQFNEEVVRNLRTEINEIQMKMETNKAEFAEAMVTMKKNLEEWKKIAQQNADRLKESKKKEGGCLIL